MEIMKDDVEKAFRVTNYIKDQAKRLKGKVRNYSGLKAAFESELYIDGGVVKTRPKDSSQNTQKIKLFLLGFTYTRGKEIPSYHPFEIKER